MQVTQTTLLVSVANWALTLGQLEGKVATDRICEFLKYCELSEDSTARVAAASHLEGLRLMWPMLAYSIVKTSPQLSEQIKARVRLEILAALVDCVFRRHWTLTIPARVKKRPRVHHSA